MDKLERLYTNNIRTNKSLTMLNYRLRDNMGPEHYYPDTIPAANHMAMRLQAAGGFTPQQRMIQDKRKTLNKVLKSSYQGAWVKRWIPDDIETMEGERELPPVRALINPDKTKQNYDDKIISVGYEYNFAPGDIFEWCNTNSYWLIYLQDLTELAYFRSEIRRCSHQISWQDEEGSHKTYAAIRGPVETKINFIQKHLISVDEPNHSLNILMPKSESILKYFKRYGKFYLDSEENIGEKICWRVEAIDSISMPGILEVNAVEYYANKDEDDIDAGLVGALITKPVDQNEETEDSIFGETFIYPKKEYIYTINSSLYGSWHLANEGKIPVKLESFINEKGQAAVKLKWVAAYSGQFDIWYGDENGPLLNYKKTIVVQTLF